MTGQHIADLKHRTTGMDEAAIDDVDISRDAWGKGATALENVARALLLAAPEIRKGFGAGSTIGQDAHDAFDQAATRISARQKDLEDAQQALEKVIPAMTAARAAAAGAPGTSPGDPPPFPTPTGTDDAAEIQALKVHARQMETYNNQVSAYAGADEDARKKVQDLKDRYREAADVFQRIHGEPEDKTPNKPGRPDPGGSGGVPPIGRPSNPYVPPPVHPTIPVTPPPVIEHPPPTIQHPPVPPVGPVHPPELPTGYPPSDPVGPHVPGGPGGPGGSGGGGGVGPAVLGGAVGAGVFGAPGIVNGIRGLLNGRGLSGSGGTIGATSRTGGPGSLTRGGGAGAPGSQVNRSSCARGAGGGRGGAAGGAGGRGGQGSRGRGGAAAGAGGRRGDRKRDDEKGQERDLFDDGQDWLDDEGAAPGVLD
ncbi:hypothetical protein [Pimelobacter simplex]|uniref:PE_PGRS family protein n=1 Tax=Nocardioides simplex TaxID=2045 RepID=A0A0A1DH51_NOCSI|nr:hypothetical protein [Pimelobacter simplex]AIY16666.1 PE_PGRS family protein [Pimelobacter simplex]